MKNSVYAPHSFFNILTGTLRSLKDRVQESGRWLLLLVLCIFTGFLGIHRFAVKKWGTGILYLLTLGLLGFGVLIDFLSLLSENFTDKSGQKIYSGLPGRQRFGLFCFLLLGAQWLMLYYTRIAFIAQGIEELKELWTLLMEGLSAPDRGLLTRLMAWLEELANL